MVLLAEKSEDIAWIISYGIVNYLAFPVVYGSAGPKSWLLILGSLAGFGILLRFVIVSYRHLVRSTPNY